MEGENNDEFIPKDIIKFLRKWFKEFIDPALLFVFINMKS